MNAQVETVETEANSAAAKRAAAIVEVVTMEDGRKVEFTGALDAPRARKMKKDSIFDEHGNLVEIRIDFRNGQTIHFVPPTALYQRLIAHGAEQKLGDEASGEKDVDDMYLAIEDLAGRLTKGEWNIQRESNGMAGVSILLKALLEHSAGRKTLEEAKAFLKSKTLPEKAWLRSNPKSPLKSIVDRLEAEKAAKAQKINVEAVLAGL